MDPIPHRAEIHRMGVNLEQINVRSGDQKLQMRPTSVLCIPLLQVAQSLSELFYRNVLVEREEMTLRGGSSVIDERVCVGGETSDSYDDVAT
jgi:hypothetical protein